MRLRHVLAAILLAGALPAFAQGLNLVTDVSVKDEGGSVVLSVTGTKPPNFTTFSMADPPRFVLDLSEAKFQGVPEDLPVNDGTILVVKNLSYGSDQTSIARIMIAFAVDVEPPDVQTQGASLVVRILKPAGAGQQAVAQAEAVPAADAQAKAAAAAAEAQAQAAADAKARADAQAAAEAQARADAQARAEAEAQARAEAERKEQERLAAESKDREAKEAAEAAAAVAAMAPAATPAPDAAPVMTEAERRKQEAAEKKAEAKRQREEALAAAQAEAQRKKEEALAKKAEAKRLREEALAAKKAEAQRVKEEALAKKAEAKRQREEALAAARADAAAKQQEALERKAEQTRAREESLAATAPSSVQEFGFKQLPGASRVFLRTSAPPRFTIQDVGENLIRVEIENARVANRNFLRFLDTSFFPSAVAMITPSRRGSSYVLDIKLKQKVPYQQKIEGDVLAIDFERPASAGAAPTPGQTDAGAAAAPDGATDALPGMDPVADPAPPEPGPAR